MLKSDFLLVRYPGDDGWLAFRDVVEVDGKPVRDATQDRLTKLLPQPSQNAAARARELADEGARYNLLDIGTLNNPLLAMAFLQPDYQPRFRFTLAGIEKELGPDVRTVRFEEFRTPTLLQADANQRHAVARADLDRRGDRPRRQDRLQVGPHRLPPEIVTTFASTPELGIDVPAEMQDWYPDGDRRRYPRHGDLRPVPPLPGADRGDDRSEYAADVRARRRRCTAGSVALGVVEAVADHELVLDREADVLDLHVDLAPRRLAEQAGGAQVPRRARAAGCPAGR